MDFQTTVDGDILIQGIDATITNIPEFIFNRIKYILRSKPGDWALNPSKGAHITQYVGFPNIPSTKDLVEEEVREELETDSILGNFDLEVIYTPTSTDAALVEIKVFLPDGVAIEVEEILKSTGGVIGRTEPRFKQAIYVAGDQITRTEVVTLENTTNLFELKYLPIDTAIFILPFDATIPLDDQNTISKDVLNETQTITITAPESTQVKFNFNATISAILESNIVQSMRITADGILLDDSEFNANEINFTVLVDPPQTDVVIDIEYFDSVGIGSVNEIPQDADPQNIFPRARITTRYIITTRQNFSPGQYFIQYNALPLEV